jgi:hypothetical protein
VAAKKPEPLSEPYDKCALHPPCPAFQRKLRIVRLSYCSFEIRQEKSENEKGTDGYAVKEGAGFQISDFKFQIDFKLIAINFQNLTASIGTGAHNPEGMAGTE